MTRRVCHRPRTTNAGRASYWPRHRRATTASGSVTDSSTAPTPSAPCSATRARRAARMATTASAPTPPPASTICARARMTRRRGASSARDPAGSNSNSPSELDRYVYASANPVNLSDPSGLSDLAEYGLTTQTSTGVSSTLVDFAVNIGLSYIRAIIYAALPEEEAAQVFGWITGRYRRSTIFAPCSTTSTRSSTSSASTAAS